MVADRPSLTNGDLDAVWAGVRDRLERRGLDNRGRLRLPELSSQARLALNALIGRQVRATVDLARLEAALSALNVGPDLANALAALGFPVSPTPAERREARQVTRAAHAAAREAAALWPEPWAAEWIDEVIRANCLRGFDVQQAVGLAASVRAVLDALSPDGQPMSRVDLAAKVLGDSHALDPGTRVETAATRALSHRLGPGDPRELWAQAGAHLDLTSGPALTWGLSLPPAGGLVALVDAATAAGVPLHLSQLALRRHPVIVPEGADILVVENPRIVEAAAQRQLDCGVIATNGNPSGAVVLLITQLLACGATLRYHGDFDSAGLAICSRMHQLGLTPWRMDAQDYLHAVADADSAGVELPTDPHPAPPTSWDPPLQAAFNRHRLIIHEERLLPDLLEPGPESPRRLGPSS